MHYKGDKGLVRAALSKTLPMLPARAYRIDNVQIFNDKRPGFRRLKIYGFDEIFEMPQKDQKRLHAALKEAFGSRVLGMYFVERKGWSKVFKFLCIKLTH